MSVSKAFGIGIRSTSLAAVFALGSAIVSAQQPAAVPEVKVQASAVIKTQTGKSSSGVPIETAEITLRVSYSDLSLATHSGQALLQDRVAEAARDACARVSAAFAAGGNLTGDSECVRNAINDARPQVDAAIRSANSRKVGSR